MKRFAPLFGPLAICLLTLSALNSAAPIKAQESPKPALDPAPEQPVTPRDFDFQVGSWRVHHRVKVSGKWLEFDGTCINRPLMAGWGNVEDHTFYKKSGVTRAMGFRAYDAKTKLWAIWWVDGRDPHGPLDPPVKGRFDEGVGTFFSDSVIDGKTIRTRYTWSQITLNSAHWEQAESSDDGKTWDTNWTMEFRRTP